MKNLKEIDFKQFLLEKGERVGVGVAVAVMLLLVVLGLLLPSHGFFSGSPAEKEKTLNEVTQRVDNGLRTAQPTDADKPEPNASKNLIDLETTPTSVKDYLIAGLFEGRAQEPLTRRPPEVLAADEGKVETTWANIETYMLRFDQTTGTPTEIFCLKDVKGAAPAGGGGLGNLFGNQGKGVFGGMSPLGGGGALGMGGSAPPGGGGSGAGMGGSAPPGMGGSGPGMGGRGNLPPSLQGQRGVQGMDDVKPHEMVSVSIRELAKKGGGLAGLTPARQLRPLRMAVIAASFPYRKQLEKFQEALHLHSPQEVLQETVKNPDPKGQPLHAFRFLGVRVQRRVLDSTGTPLTKDWQDTDLGTFYRPWLVVTGRRFEPENPKYVPISFLGLVMRPLLQFRDKPHEAPAEPAADDLENHYPAIEAKLNNINETLESLKSKDPAEIAKPPDQFNPDNPFDPFNPSAMPEGSQKTGGNTTTGTAGAAQTIPEHCLIRLIDLTIEPGKRYQYRIQVRMANPNYQRTDVANPAWAEKDELPSDQWYEIPEQATVPPELEYYAVDQQEADLAEGHKYTGINAGYVDSPDRKTVLQVHRWLGTAVIEKMGREPLMIGEWAVADRVPVFRGEYADRKVRLELPVWSSIHNAFLIPTDQDGRRNRKPGIEVNFSHGQGDRETVLVDFDGGKQSYKQFVRMGDDEVKTVTTDDSSQTEVLLMTPEGKLLGHGSAADSQDKHRKEQRDDAARRVDHVRHGKPDPASQPNKKNDPFGKSGN
jgi:hypothetical protein